MGSRPLQIATALFFIACGGGPAPHDPYNHFGPDLTKEEAVIQSTVGKTGRLSAAQLLLAGDQKAPIDEELAYGVLDSLISPHPSTRGIQARAISRIWPRCDGALAKVVGNSAFRYVQQHPVEFFALFPSDIPWQELAFWSDMIAQELIIEHESHPNDAAMEFSKGINETAKLRGADLRIEVARMELQILSRIAELNASNAPR